MSVDKVRTQDFRLKNIVGEKMSDFFHADLSGMKGKEYGSHPYVTGVNTVVNDQYEITDETGGHVVGKGDMDVGKD